MGAKVGSDQMNLHVTLCIPGSLQLLGVRKFLMEFAKNLFFPPIWTILQNLMEVYTSVPAFYRKKITPSRHLFYSVGLLSNTISGPIQIILESMGMFLIVFAFTVFKPIHSLPWRFPHNKQRPCSMETFMTGSLTQKNPWSTWDDMWRTNRPSDLLLQSWPATG